MKKINIRGLLATVAVLLMVGVVPIAELLPWNATELMFWRGASGVFFAALLLVATRATFKMPELSLIFTSLAFTVASFAVFKAIGVWGSNLSMVMLDMAVVVPFLISLFSRDKVKKMDLWIFSIAILGSILALRAWDSSIDFEGFLWSLLAMVANGLSIYFSGNIKNTSENGKVLCFSLPLVIVGALFLRGEVLVQASTSTLVLTLVFSLCLGYFNFLFAFLAVKYLGSVLFGVLLIGVTPIVLLVSYLVLGKFLGPDQLLGVMITLSALSYRSFQLYKSGK